MARQKIDDAGAIIAGARKFGSGRRLTLDDLAEMTREEAAQSVTKDNIWPKPDYEALVDAGMAPEAAAAIKIIRDRMAAKPRFNILQPDRKTLRDPGKVARDFVRMTAAVRDVLMDTGRIRTMNDVASSSRLIREEIGSVPGVESLEIKYLLASISKGGTSPLFNSATDPVEARNLVAEGFPGKVPAWRRGVVVEKRYDGTFHLRKGKRLLGRGFASESEALSWLQQNNSKPNSTRRTTRRIKPKRPHPESIQREGGRDYRGGRNITDGEEFIHTFGFRGVQFGDWLPNEERQEVLNHAYDALMDLASVLGIESEDLSLGGELALAFGARGTGTAAAHYEAGQRVLNLTRLKGAGSLAHEFAHAFDHWSGDPSWSGDAPAHPGGIPSGSGWNDLHLDRKGYLTNLPDTQAEVWHRMMNGLYRGEGDTGGSRIKPTGYVRDAIMIGGSLRSYWARPTEIFARAFEAFVYDRLTQSGVSSPYLVHGVEEDRFTEESGFVANPYPTGAERKLFNANLESLVVEMPAALERIRKPMAEGRNRLAM